MKIKSLVLCLLLIGLTSLAAAQEYLFYSGNLVTGIQMGDTSMERVITLVDSYPDPPTEGDGVILGVMPSDGPLHTAPILPQRGSPDEWTTELQDHSSLYTVPNRYDCGYFGTSEADIPTSGWTEPCYGHPDFAIINDRFLVWDEATQTMKFHSWLNPDDPRGTLAQARERLDTPPGPRSNILEFNYGVH